MKAGVYIHDDLFAMIVVGKIEAEDFIRRAYENRFICS